MEEKRIELPKPRKCNCGRKLVSSLGKWEVIPYGLVEVLSSGEAVLANGSKVRLPTKVFEPIKIMSRGA